MQQRILVTLVLIGALGGLARSAEAQTRAVRETSLLTGVAFTNQWDDETHLGTGALVSAGISHRFPVALRVEAEVSVGRHHRDSGYLEATGTPVVLTGRGAWLIGPARWSTRPFVSVGATLTHSRGEFVSRHPVAGPNGFPIDGPVVRQPWRITRRGWEIGLGAEAGRRLTWRPEFRVSATAGNPSYVPGHSTLEIPILTARAGLTVLW